MKNKEWNKMLLIVAALLYVLSVVCFITDGYWAMLFLMLVHGIVLLFYSYRCSLAVIDNSQEKKLEEELGKRESELYETKEQLRMQKSLFADENATHKERIVELQKEVSERDNRIAEKQRELEDMERGTSVGKRGTEGLLPPIDETVKETVDIIKIAKDTVYEFEKEASRAHIRMHVSAADNNLMVRANASRIYILFKNVIDNSIKYMKKDGTLVITISRVADEIFLVFKDNGMGLSEAETDHIFELNYQGSNRISGNGLGLTQARAIVESYGGTVYAKSSIGCGMGIYIQLPTT